MFQTHWLMYLPARLDSARRSIHTSGESFNELGGVNGLERSSAHYIS